MPGGGEADWDPPTLRVPDTEGPTWRERGGRILPLVVVVVVTLGFTLVPPHAPDAPLLVAGAVACLAVVGLFLTFAPATRLHPFWNLSAVAVFCLAVGLLRESGGGGPSGYVALLLLPIVWVSIHGRPVELVWTLGFVALTYMVPIVLVGEPYYPTSQWRGAILFTAIGGGIGVLLTQVTAARDELLARLQAAATTDALTGLANRWLWNDLLEREIARAIRTATPLTVAILDIDHFKAFNDRNGHNAGDQLLRHLATTWKAEMRRTDALARWGGEEFVLLMPDTTTAEAVEVTARLLRSCERVTCSAGVASLGAGRTSEGLIGDADRHLYAAKAAGRDRIVWSEGIVIVGAAD